MSNVHTAPANRPPRIGVTCGTQVQETAFGQQSTISLNMSYVAAVARAGGIPVPVPPSGADVVALVAGLDGLILTGGGDLDPACYGEEPAAEVYGVDPERDRLEFAALAAAEQADVPVLAICRGLQLVNVSRGGSLIQHVDDEALHWQTTPAHEGAHAVDIHPGSRLASFVGPEQLMVNSYHHQAIGRLGDGLVVVADAGGLVEAFETTDGLVLGVQWHPEQMFDHHPRQFALFEQFVLLAGTGAAGREVPTPAALPPTPPTDTTAWSVTHA
jgi:putative glutamine amidotransferase